jgi:hypothetical protein
MAGRGVLQRRAYNTCRYLPEVAWATWSQPPPVVLTLGDHPVASLKRRFETQWLRLITDMISRPMNIRNPSQRLAVEPVLVPCSPRRCRYLVPGPLHLTI